MLPPMLPLSAVPITSQQDPIRQRPDIPPVVPVQESSNESTIDLQKRDPEEAALSAARGTAPQAGTGTTSS